MRRDIEDLDNVDTVSKAQLNGNNHYNLDYYREKITFRRTPNHKFKRFSKFKNDHLINYNFYKNFWSSI